MSFRTRTFTLACTLFFLANSVHAMKIHIDMKPPLLGEEFAFEMNPKENGKVVFIIKRDPSKAIEPADDKLRRVRGSSLSVFGSEGLTTETRRNTESILKTPCSSEPLWFFLRWEGKRSQRILCHSG